MLYEIDDNPDYLKRVLFSDEATFHTKDDVNRHISQIWGSKQPNIVQELVHNLPKLNVWYIDSGTI